MNENLNEQDAIKNFPRYLFKEKEVFLNIYRKINSKKRLGLIKLIYKTEKLIRLNSGLYRSIGLRFLLNFKKIIIS